LRRASRPHVAVLGRVPGTDLYGDIARNPENEQTPGVFVFRVDSAILYFNAEYIREQFSTYLNALTTPVTLAIWSLSTTASVDLAGAEMLEHLRAAMGKRGIELKLAEARGPVREQLRAAGLEAHFGPIQENMTIAPMVAGWRASTPPSGSLERV